MPDRQRVDRCVSLVQGDLGYLLRVDLDGDLPLGLAVHGGDRNAAVHLVLGRSIAAMVEPGRACLFPPEAGAEAVKTATDLRNRLFAIAKRPISQRHVERLLGITPGERNRWSKDGRLTKSGTAQIRKGTNLITLSTYATDAIEALSGEPAIIQAWREADDAYPDI